jgi:hypothetical protein
MPSLAVDADADADSLGCLLNWTLTMLSLTFRKNLRLGFNDSLNLLVAETSRTAPPREG